MLGGAVPDEPAGGFHRIGCLGEERPEQLESVGLDWEQLEVCLDAVILRVGGELLGVHESGIPRGGLDEHRRKAGEVRAQRIDDRIVYRMAG